MNYLALVWFSIFTILVLSCDQKVKEEAWEDDTLPKPKIVLDGNESDVAHLIVKMEMIDQQPDTSYRKVRSLRWEYSSDSVGEVVEVTAFVNKEGYPAKIIEAYYEDANQRQGEKNYYYEKETLIATADLYDEWKHIEGGMMYYDQVFYENEEVTYARHKEAKEVDMLSDVEWEEAQTPTVLNPERALAILGQTTPFETHFLSIIESNNSLYLLLGEPKDGDRYVTVLRVEDVNVPFVQDLLKNRTTYRYRPIAVQYEIVGGNGSPEFRVMRGAKWMD